MANALKKFIAPIKVPKFVKTGGHEATPEDKTVRKSVLTKDGSIQKVPTNAKDIVNKEYVDAAVAGVTVAHAATTGQTTDDHHPQVHTHTHASTTGQGTDDHHPEVHSLNSHTQGNNKVFYSDNVGDLIELGIENDPTKYLTATVGTVPFFKVPDHTELATVGVNDHHAQLHAIEHEDGGGDELRLQSIVWDATLVYQGGAAGEIRGGTATGTDFILKANTTDTYPFIKLNGDANIEFEVATGDLHNFKVNGVSIATINAVEADFKALDINTIGDATVGKLFTGDWESTADCVAILGDNAGAQKFRVKDSVLATVFDVDSNGNAKVYVDLEVVGDVFTVAWTDYGATSTIVGWQGGGLVKNIWYKKVGNLVFVKFTINGTSNAVNATFTLPYNSVNSAGSGVGTPIQFVDNAVASPTSGMASLVVNGNTVTLYTDWAATAWQPVGNKIANGEFFYEAA